MQNNGSNQVGRIRKFNPGTLQSDREVIDQFVVRNHELDMVLKILQSNVESPSCQHVLIVAPRGRGKTMLLARTAAELRVNDEFSSTLLPVRFMEESQEIFNMADFWLETLFHLSRECTQSQPKLAQELQSIHVALEKQWNSDLLEDRARNVVLDAADRLERKLVLMIENLQALFEDVNKDFGWKLRKVLQTEPQIMLLGSATSRFEGLTDADQPFFDLFRIIELNALNTDECQRLWTTISGDNTSDREMRPLEILTGGSPRLLVIIAGFARHKSMRWLMEELVLLIDEHTDYFRGNLEALPKTERRVYLAIIDLWQLSTPSEISTRARMDIRKVSTMLGRLVNRGAVIVEGNGRRRRYTAAERLYSIYYKLRRDRDETTVVQNLIRFMIAFYTDAEQNEIFSALFKDFLKSRAMRDGFYRATAENPEIYKKLVGIGVDGIQDEGELLTKRQQIFAEIQETFEQNEFHKVIKMIDQELSSLCSVTGHLQPLLAQVMYRGSLMKVSALQKLGKLESAIKTLEETVDCFDAAESSELQAWSVRILNNKMELQIESGRYIDAFSTYQELGRRFGELDVQEKVELSRTITVVGPQTPLTSENIQYAVYTFKLFYDEFDYNKEREVKIILDFAIEIIAAGVPPHSLLKIASGDDFRKAALSPLIVALRLEAGEAIRAPEEVLEVAADILEDVKKKRLTLV